MAFPLKKKILTCGCKCHTSQLHEGIGCDYKTVGFWGWPELYYTKKKIHAPWGGTVHIIQGTEGGLWIKLTRVMGDRIEFGHCAKAYVKNGARVSQGKLIGLTGNSGAKTTGPHLHIQIFRNGKRVCPESYRF